MSQDLYARLATLRFAELLQAATVDGAKKREAGTKVPWPEDEGHWPALQRHLHHYQANELVDPDSGAHPLVHVAWRALAIAWQETHEGQAP